MKIKCNGCNGKGAYMYNTGPEICSGCHGRGFEEIETMEQYIDYMINMGYWHKDDLEPIKCDHCEGTNLEDYDYDYMDYYVCEYARRCKDCNHKVGHWAYGNWCL